jgi:integrase
LCSTFTYADGGARRRGFDAPDGLDPGHRCMAVARLRWSDVDLEAGRITWRKASDKMRREHILPVSRVALAALKAERRRLPRIGDGWLFPAAREPERPVSRHLVGYWWDRLEAAAALEGVAGRGWHSLRRKFATDHRERPLADVMALGGWKDAATLVKCYQQPPEEGLRAALESRVVRVQRGR